MKRGYCFWVFLVVLYTGLMVPSPTSAQSWEQQNSPTTNTLYDVTFVDSSLGWAVGDSGTIIYTTDGGGVWTIQTSGTTVNLKSLDFVDQNLGWAVGCDWNADSSIIVHTTDGGITWTRVAQ